MNTPTTAQLQRRIADLKFQLADRNRDLQTALAEIDCLRARNAMLTELAGDLRVAQEPTPEIRRQEANALAALRNRNKVIDLNSRRGRSNINVQ